MTTDTQPCSVCGSAVNESPRYPDRLYTDEYCYVEGVKCLATDGYFGGIIAQPERFWDETV